MMSDHHNCRLSLKASPHNPSKRPELQRLEVSMRCLRGQAKQVRPSGIQSTCDHTEAGTGR